MVNKPAGWHCVRPSTDGRPVAERLRENLEPCKELPGSLPSPGPGHHRVPGVAKWRPIRERLRAMSGDPQRPAENPLALVTPGLPPVGRFELYFYGHNARVRTSEAGHADQQGVCCWKLIRPAKPEASDATQFDAMEVSLIGPGRRHQIRAGLSHFGHPLANDQTYEGPTWAEGTGLAALHAHRIKLDGTTVVAPPPETWHLEQLQTDESS